MAAFADFPSLLDARARDSTEAPAVSFYRGRAAEGRLDYFELLDRVERAAGLLFMLGVQPGDRVALLSHNRLEVPCWLLALWRLGAVAVPLNPAAPHDDWAYILEHAAVRGCIGARDLLTGVGGLDFLRPIDDFGVAPPAPPLVGSLADEPAIILYTSGTTGQPKGVVLSQRSLLANAAGLAERFRLTRATQLAVLPLYHAHALGFGLLTALVSGGHLVLAERMDPFAWAEVIRAEQAAWASVVPSLLPLILQARVTHAKAPSLRALLVSSAPLSVELARDFERRTEVPLVQGWGLSEFTNFACCMRPHAAEPARRALLFDHEVPSVGSALDGAEVSVRDEFGHELAEGLRGELCVRGPSRMSAYFRDPEATRRATFGDWLRTGDQGYYRLHSGERAFFVTGRLKEIIIRGGEKHSPLAVERRLLGELPELTGRLVIVGFEHALVGEEIGAYVEADALSHVERQQILRAVEKLPIELRPKIILHGVAPIPRTHTGKVQRGKLAARFAGFKECKGPPRIVAA